MPLVLDTSNRFNRDPVSGSIECPHCQANAHMALMAAPGIKVLQAKKPGQVGMVFQCDACHSPVFLKFRVKQYQPDRIIFHSAAHEVERPAEKFKLNYLPEQVALSFREALGCYRHGLLQAFAAMCRLTAEAVFDDLGESGKLKIFDQLEEIREIADLSNSVFTTVQQVVFGAADSRSPLPVVGRGDAAVLLETIKDLLYQAYIREARLRRALEVRRFFADQADTKVSSLDAKKPSRSTGTS
jgi:DNA-directed RNA polymerase subunit RPC12/RpoP